MYKDYSGILRLVIKCFGITNTSAKCFAVRISSAKTVPKRLRKLELLRTKSICLFNLNDVFTPCDNHLKKLEPQGALIAHLSTMSTSVIS